MDRNYWQNYYQAHLSIKEQQQSNFASFCVERFFKSGANLIELGCGNGRDSIYFAKNGIKTLGIDQCENVIDFLNKNHGSDNLSFKSGDFTALPNARELTNEEKFDIIYSRFTLHSINAKQQENLFAWIRANLKESGILAIECRGYKNSLYRLGVMVETDAFIYENHYRRFVNFEKLCEILGEDYEILFAKEDRGFAPFNGEDDYFVRVIGLSNNKTKKHISPKDKCES